MNEDFCHINECPNEENFGRKAHLLGMASKEGLRVPHGGVLSYRALKEFETALEIKDQGGASEVEAYIELLLKSFDFRYGMAVRSSALIEDVGPVTYAGRFESCFCAPHIDEIEASILRVLKSSGDNKLSRRSGEMAIILQNLIPADVAGVAYSRGIGLGYDRDCIIEANWGMGFTVTGGEIIPDFFRITPGDRDNAYECILGEKEIVGKWVDNQVVVERANDAIRKSPCLGNREIEQIAKLAEKCDSLLSHPADIEFALFNSEIYLLQLRKINYPCDSTQ